MASSSHCSWLWSCSDFSLFGSLSVEPVYLYLHDTQLILCAELICLCVFSLNQGNKANKGVWFGLQCFRIIAVQRVTPVKLPTAMLITTWKLILNARDTFSLKRFSALGIEPLGSLLAGQVPCHWLGPLFCCCNVFINIQLTCNLELWAWKLKHPIINLTCKVILPFHIRWERIFLQVKLIVLLSRANSEERERKVESEQ